MIAHSVVNTAIDLRLLSTSICFVHHPGLPYAKCPSNVDVVFGKELTFCAKFDLDLNESQFVVEGFGCPLP
jgi:hypothetical protein